MILLFCDWLCDFLSINSLNSAKRALSPGGQGGDAVTQVRGAEAALLHKGE